MLNMIGVGPFLTIPLILTAMGGPQALVGWILGAVIAICDGLVWAELGAAMPGSGGPYYYLQQAYRPLRLGGLMSFLFLWGTVVIAPLSVASGAVGFSQYLKYFWAGMTGWEAKLIAAFLCLLATVLLYREIPAVGRLSVAMWIVVLFAAAWVVFAGLTHFDWKRVIDFPPGAFRLNAGFFAGLGGATLIAMYDYGGYFNVCYFGAEVKDPARTIPRSILYAIGLVAALYLTMNVTIIGVIPWREAAKSTAIVSDFIERLYGVGAARVMTGLILWTTFASIFAIMLGYSRVPYAAAAEGRFFAPFARLHPVKNFPSFAVVTLGVSSALACAFDLDAIIKALIIIQTMVQFMAQVVAVTLIRRYRPDIQRPFRMWLYPLPSIVAFGGWLYILLSNGITYVLAGLALLLVGIGVYFWREGKQRGFNS
jgi:amino acid transporter